MEISGKTTHEQAKETEVASDPNGMRTADLDLVGHVKVALIARVGTVDLPMRELFALKKGDVVSMNERVDAAVDLLLDGRVVARGELLAVDDHFGIRILELV